MPGARSGKCSINTFTGKLSGASASQKINAAEWSGELAWVKSHHNSNKVQGSGPGSWPPAGQGIDYSKPYFEHRQGDWYCLLCNAWATDTHVWSDKHQSRAETPEWYMTETRLQQPEFQKPWFEEREGDMYCLLCSSWATEGHVQSEKHKKREAYPDYYWPAGGGGVQVKCSAAQLIGLEYNKPWFQLREGDWYCMLCGNWATEGHLSSEKHMRRAEYPDAYGFPDVGPSAPTTLTHGQAEGEVPHAGPTPHGQTDGGDAVPPPWQQIWSQDHDDYYYHNLETNETQWERPQPAYCQFQGASPSPTPQSSTLKGLVVETNAAFEVAAGSRSGAAEWLGEPALPKSWEMAYDIEGRPFYYNMSTQISQWERPTPEVEEC